MMILASILPNLFSRMGTALFIALSVSLLANFIAMLLGYNGDAFNWIFVIIFSLYIGFDWYRAQQFPKTLDNAIDCVLDLYLDIINLFLRILEIISRRND
jgi:FtsH-binding integral membrane protein